MVDHHNWTRLASELFPQAAAPEFSPSDGGSEASQGSDRPCRKFYPGCEFPVAGCNQCSECGLVDDSHLKPDKIDQMVELLRRHRAMRWCIEQAVQQVHSSHVAAIFLEHDALFVGCDDRGQSFLKNAHVLKVANGYLHCNDPVSQSRFLAALEKTALTGQTASLLVCPIGEPEQRFSMTLANMQNRETTILNGDHSTCFSILCLLSRLDQRRFATVRQLMELFALSAAEARLTRALCQGNSLEEYASDQGLKLPTVRTQLRSALAKTGTGRQATLICLVAGIPVIR
jgi:DNA-binding CsgD family transcriptional regulator